MRVRRMVLRVSLMVVMSAALGAAPASGDDPSGPATATMAVQHVALPEGALREEVAMVLLGAALIGLAAAVRRAA